MVEPVVKNIIGLIPVHNEEGGIKRVIAEAKKYLETILVVDDGSEDKTFQEAKEAGAILLRHSKNEGKGRALKTGFDFVLKNYSGAEGVIILDGDGQHDPNEIMKFIEIFKEGNFDLVLGERVINKNKMPFLRMVGNLFVSGLVSVKIGQKIIDSQSGFRLFSRQFLDKLKLDSIGYGVETELLLFAAKNRFSIATIPVSVNYINKNQINFLKDARIIASIIGRLLS